MFEDLINLYKDNLNTKDYAILAYTSLYILTAVLTYAVPMRQVSIFGFTTYGSIFILPLWYVLGDAIAELFGIKASRFLVWMSIIACLLFSLIISGIMKLAYPIGWTGEPHFDYVFGNLLTIGILCNLAAIIGGYLNGYLITRWKFLLKGRHFFLRSIGSSFISDFIQIAISVFITLYSFLSFQDFIKTIIVTYLFHVILMTLYSLPNSLIVSMLKVKIGIKEFNFNPFLK